MEYTKEQQEELDRIDAHIKALEIGYNNCIKLLTKPIKLMEFEAELEDDEEEEENNESSELLALKLGQLKKFYAQGVDELSKVAENLYVKITDKKKEREGLIAKYTGGENLVANTESLVAKPPQQSAASQKLK